MDGKLIYAKTPKGIAEVAARSAQLSMTARRVLIMMDGKRTIDELAVLVRPGEIEGIIGQLEEGGLAQKAGADADGGSDVPVVSSSEPEADLAPTTATSVMDDRDLNPMTLEEAKRRAVRELTDRLGPGAEVVAIRIENCRTIEHFRDRVREAERLVATALGAAAAQDYLRALRRRA
jgi:hypothetical protein